MIPFCESQNCETKQHGEWLIIENRHTKKHYPAKPIHSIKSTRRYCHWLSPPLHQCGLKQEYTIHQQYKLARGVCCIWKWMRPGRWVKINSNLLCLDSLYQTKVRLSSLLAVNQSGVWKATWCILVEIRRATSRWGQTKMQRAGWTRGVQKV